MKPVPEGRVFLLAGQHHLCQTILAKQVKALFCQQGCLHQSTLLALLLLPKHSEFIFSLIRSAAGKTWS